MNAYPSNLSITSAPTPNNQGSFDVTFKFDIICSPTNPMVIGTKTITTAISNTTTLSQLNPSCYKMAMEFITGMLNS